MQAAGGVVDDSIVCSTDNIAASIVDEGEQVPAPTNCRAEEASNSSQLGDPIKVFDFNGTQLSAASIDSAKEAFAAYESERAIGMLERVVNSPDLELELAAASIVARFQNDKVAAIAAAESQDLLKSILADLEAGRFSDELITDLKREKDGLSKAEVEQLQLEAEVIKDLEELLRNSDGVRVRKLQVVEESLEILNKRQELALQSR